MATKKDVIDRLDFVTDRLSTQVRTLGLGVLAVTWGIFVGDSPTARGISSSLRILLMLTAACSIFALLLDFLQYVAGHRDAKRVLDAMERERNEEAKYDTSHFTYRIQPLLFSAKQWAATLAALGLLGTIAYHLIR